MQSGPSGQALVRNGCNGGVHQAANRQLGSLHDAKQKAQPTAVHVSGNRKDHAVDWGGQVGSDLVEVGVDQIRSGEMSGVGPGQRPVVELLPEAVVDAAGKQPRTARRVAAHGGRITVEEGDSGGRIGDCPVRNDGHDTGVGGLDGDQLHGVSRTAGVTCRCCTKCRST